MSQTRSCRFLAVNKGGAAFGNGREHEAVVFVNLMSLFFNY